MVQPMHFRLPSIVMAAFLGAAMLARPAPAAEVERRVEVPDPSVSVPRNAPLADPVERAKAEDYRRRLEAEINRQRMIQDSQRLQRNDRLGDSIERERRLRGLQDERLNMENRLHNR